MVLCFGDKSELACGHGLPSEAGCLSEEAVSGHVSVVFPASLCWFEVGLQLLQFGTIYSLLASSDLRSRVAYFE